MLWGLCEWPWTLHVTRLPCIPCCILEDDKSWRNTAELLSFSLLLLSSPPVSLIGGSGPWLSRAHFILFPQRSHSLRASRESGTAVSIQRLRNGTRGRSYVGKLFVMHTQGDMQLRPQQANKSSHSLVPSSNIPPTPQSVETHSCFQKLPGSQHHRY